MPVSSASTNRPLWGTYYAFLMAAIGSSIGLGNVWKFPYELGIHGGTFLYVYLACVVLLAFPLMVSELMLGRLGQAGPVKGIVNIAKQERLSSMWQIIGWLGVLSSFLIFSYYSAVASWVLFYAMKSISGAFTNVPAEIVQHQFGALLRNTDQMILWHTVFILLVVLVLAQEVRSGLEKAVRWLMPAFGLLLFVVALYSRKLGDYDAAFEFMFHFDWRDIDAELLLSALTQSLFSLSIGIGVLMMYGSYLDTRQPIILGAATIMIFDTASAILMGAIIFSIVFAYGMAPDSGVGLIFETLPVAFSQMTENSILVSSLFFFLVLFAALASGFALLEPSIALMVSRFKIKRRTAAWLIGALAWLLGGVSIYSFSDYKFAFYYFSNEREYGFFDLFNIVSVHLILPLTAILIAILAAWRITESSAREALSQPYDKVFSIWRVCNRFFLPAALVIVILAVIFLPD